MSSIGAKINAFYELREKKRTHEKFAKDFKKQMDVVEAELLELMRAEGVIKSTGLLATASIKTNSYPRVENWDSFYAFIRRENFFHLLERRPSVSGCNELFEMKGVIPGVVPFTETVVNLRGISESGE